MRGKSTITWIDRGSIWNLESVPSLIHPPQAQCIEGAMISTCSECCVPSPAALMPSPRYLCHVGLVFIIFPAEWKLGKCATNLVRYLVIKLHDGTSSVYAVPY